MKGYAHTITDMDGLHKYIESQPELTFETGTYNVIALSTGAAIAYMHGSNLTFFSGPTSRRCNHTVHD